MTESEYSISDHEACIDCGICCQVFWQRKVSNGTASLHPRSKQWVEKEIEDMTAEEAIALDLLAYPPEQIHSIIAKGYKLARCKLLDPETKKCTDYENRPPGCVNYPTYTEVKQHKHCPLYDIIAAERKEATP